MPVVSFYLKQEILDAVRAHAKANRVSVSRIIREAVEQYLAVDETRAAKERVLDVLSKKKPLGSLKEWDEIHKERGLKIVNLLKLDISRA